MLPEIDPRRRCGLLCLTHSTSSCKAFDQETFLMRSLKLASVADLMSLSVQLHTIVGNRFKLHPCIK